MAPQAHLDNDLVQRLPLPLAQLYRRAHNAKSALERHQTAFYLWEAALKLLGSVCVVEYAALGTAEPELAESLQNLARPALGHWWEFVRRLLPVLADRGVPGFPPLRDLLLGKPRDDLPQVAGLDAAVRKALDGHAGARAAVYPVELFDRLIRYRNREIGHGAAGMAAAEIYDRLGSALLAGTAELLRRMDVLAGRRLLYVSEIREVRGIWKVERLELVGEAPRRLEPLDVARTQAAGLPSGERLYLAQTGSDGATGPLTALHPLLVFDAEANTCAFLSARRGKARAEYLCYTSARTSERPDLGDEQRALLARALRLPAVSAEQAGAWAAHSQAGEPSAEQGAGPARRRLGEYELLSELGRGGMGVVYRAWQPALGRQVALKCLARPGDPKAEARFRREIRALGQVEHPHLVKVFTSGSDGEQWFYVMELVEGVPLAAVCDKLSSAGGSVTEVDLPAWRTALDTAVDEQRTREKPLSDTAAARPLERPAWRREHPEWGEGARHHVDRGYVDCVVELVRQAAGAAEALHRHGIVHRDIKPGNLLVDSTGNQATLMDLGLAQVADDFEGKLTRTRQFVGTLRYASPEQVLAVAAVDGRSDVYSLGATLWELLALQPLFGATEATPTPELMQTIQREEPKRLRSVHPGLTRDLEAVAHRCLEKKASDRYATARELADDLGRYLEGEPVRARPAGWLDRQVKWLRRHPKEATAYGLALLTTVLLVLGVGFAWLWQAAAAAHRHADAARSTAENAQASAEDAKNKLAGEKLRSERAIQAQLEAETQTRKAREAEAAANKRAEESARELLSKFQYVEAIRRAYHFLESDNEMTGAAELQGTEPKLRHWEWRYLAEKLPRVLKGHEKEVRSVSFSPDGRWLASGSEDDTVRVWDLVGGGEPRILKRRYGLGPVGSVSFSPDGCRLASGSESHGGVALWDLANGSEPLRLKELDNGSSVFSMSFSPDGHRLACAGGFDTVSVWDLIAGGKPLLLKMRKGSTMSVSFSPDGRQLACGSADHTVRVWDLAAGGEPRVLKGHTMMVVSVSFSPDGRRLASASNDHTVRVWDLAAGGEPRVLEGHEKEVWSVSFSPDGRRLASASNDHTVRVWDLAAGGEPRVLEGHEKEVWSVSFSPDGRRLASGSNDHTVRVWDLVAGGEPRVLKGHEKEVRSVTFTPDGRRLASGSNDHTVRVWDLSTGGEPRTLTGGEPRTLQGHPGSMSFSPDGRRLAAGAVDQQVLVWDLATVSEPLVLKGPKSHVIGVSFNQDGRRLIAGEVDGIIWEWDVAAAGRVLGRDSLEMWHGGGMAFSPDGRRLGDFARQPMLSHSLVTLWERRTGGGRFVTRVGFPPFGPELRKTGSEFGLFSDVRSLSFSPDGGQVAAGYDSGSVRLAYLADLDDPRDRSVLLKGHERSVLSVTFSPDGSRLASGSEDRTIRLWDLAAAGKPLLVMGHGSAVMCLSFSPDGRRLASGAKDGTLRVWDVATGSELLELKGHAKNLVGVSFSPDGRRLAGGYLDGSVRVWETGCRHLWTLREASSAEAKESWYAARFHLQQLEREELALQLAGAASGMTSPQPLHWAITSVTLQQREGRTPLSAIRQRNYRACLELDDWAGAEDAFGRLRDLKADTTSVWHQRAWAMLAQALRHEMLRAVTEATASVPNQGPAPLAALLGLWPRAHLDTSGFRRVCAWMVEQFPLPTDATSRHHLALTRLLVGDGLTESNTARLEQLGRLALDSKKDDVGYVETYGAALYRSGQVLHEAGKSDAAGAKFRQALMHLEAAVKQPGQGGSVWQQCFLAMTQHRIGQVQEARATLTKAVRQIEQSKNPGFEARVQGYYLRQEAENTLGRRVPQEEKSEPR